MSTLIDDITLKIAARVRGERTARRWSLEDLAERSQVSKAMISKIERAEASPTAALLGRLSGAYGITLSALLADSEIRYGPVRRADQAVWRDPATGYVRRQVSASANIPIELTEVDLPAGAAVSFPASSYAFISQVIWVLAGRLTFVEGEIAHDIGPGELVRARRAGRSRVQERYRRAVPLSGRGAAPMTSLANHNQGPPLDDEEGPEWGDGDIYIYYSWKNAHQRAWKPKSRDMALFRLAKAEALGLTYEEYTLELLERGRYLQREDVDRIDAIKRKRPL